MTYTQQMFTEIPLSQKKRGGARKLIHGRGINDAPYMTTYTSGGVRFTCPYFFKWRQMYYRCYSKNWLKRHPTYQGCEVAPEWHSFMAFRQWMERQQWIGKQLDKDLLSKGKKVYSPSTCLFVSPQINSLFNERVNAQGDLPLGIYARNGKYEVGCSRGEGKRTWVGVYATIPEAIDAYIDAKREAVENALQKETNPKVRKTVQEYMDYFADKLATLKARY